MFMTLVPAPRQERVEAGHRPARAVSGLRTALGLALAGPRAVLRALRHRREVEMLLGAEPGMLRDLGLTRLDLAAALAEPLWRDPSARLLAWSDERRAAVRPGPVPFARAAPRPRPEAVPAAGMSPVRC